MRYENNTVRTRPSGLTLFIVAAYLLMQPPAQIAQDRKQQETAQPFAGSWLGMCADGKPFVLLTLRVNGNEVTGTISLANIKGDEGQCAVVVDAPSPDHAMKITDGQMKAKVLAFKGSERLQFEMILLGTDGAQLKFMGTPVEYNPWKLTRSN